MLSAAGSMMGSVVALPLCGLLCKYGFDDGWASIFYVIGNVVIEFPLSLQKLFLKNLLIAITEDIYCFTADALTCYAFSQFEVWTCAVHMHNVGLFLTFVTLIATYNCLLYTSPSPRDS